MNRSSGPGYQALRKGRFSQVNSRYFITACTRNRENLLTQGSAADVIFQSSLECAEVFELIASVVMPVHVHLVIRLKTVSVTRAIQEFKSRSAIAINRKLSRSGSLWQPVSFDHKFRSDEDLAPILQYMWNNPETPGENFRCKKEEWLWFKSMVTSDMEYPKWLSKNPLG